MSFSPNGAALWGLAPRKNQRCVSPADYRRSRHTGEDTTIPADLWLPRTTSLVLSTELDELVLQAEGEDLFKVVVRSLGLFGVGESTDGDTIKDGLAVGSLGEDEGGWAVADCGDRLGSQYWVSFLHGWILLS